MIFIDEIELTTYYYWFELIWIDWTVDDHWCWHGSGGRCCGGRPVWQQQFEIGAVSTPFRQGRTVLRQLYGRHRQRLQQKSRTDGPLQSAGQCCPQDQRHEGQTTIRLLFLRSVALHFLPFLSFFAHFLLIFFRFYSIFSMYWLIFCLFFRCYSFLFNFILFHCISLFFFVDFLLIFLDFIPFYWISLIFCLFFNFQGFYSISLHFIGINDFLLIF